MGTKRIEERKARDRQARRAQIIDVARRMAEAEGWQKVTVRRLSDEISYSQPVLYSHFQNREAIVSAVAVEGFRDLGSALEVARQRGKPKNPFEAAAEVYLKFAADSPALYEAMFTQRLSVPFDDPATPQELRFAFSQIMKLFPERSKKSEILAELFWASLHGVAELSRTKRFPPKRQRERVQALVEIFGRRGGGKPRANDHAR